MGGDDDDEAGLDMLTHKLETRLVSTLEPLNLERDILVSKLAWVKLGASWVKTGCLGSNWVKTWVKLVLPTARSSAKTAGAATAATSAWVGKCSLTHSLKGARFQPLNLSSENLVSKFAFKLNL